MNGKGFIERPEVVAILHLDLSLWNRRDIRVRYVEDHNTPGFEEGDIFFFILYAYFRICLQFTDKLNLSV